LLSAFSSEVDPVRVKKTRQNDESGVPFRFYRNGKSSGRSPQRQAMILTLVPWPGGSAACTGGGALRESLSSFTSGGLVWTGGGGATGGGALTLETLIENPFLGTCDETVRVVRQRLVNPVAQSVRTAANRAPRLVAMKPLR
jgi:hypothetical protein